MTDAREERPRSQLRRWWPVVKWSLFVVVLAFVAKRVWDLWSADREAIEALHVDARWLVPAVLAYVAGWWPSIWFWRVLLRRLGQPVATADAARAYYCGHLGKYIPGKALVLVIRAALVKGRGAGAAAAALTAAYETLAMMAVGLALGVSPAPAVMHASVWETAPAGLDVIWSWAWFRTLWTTPGLMPLVIAALVAASLPVFSRLASLLARKMVPDELSGNGNGDRRRSIDAPLLAVGMLVLIAAWWIHGLSLGCVITAVSGEPFDLTRWPAWTAAVSLATSIGFAAIFAPGGAGVREWVLVEVLRVQPGIAAQAAVAAALLLRIVWLLAEICTAAALYYGWKPRQARR